MAKPSTHQAYYEKLLIPPRAKTPSKRPRSFNIRAIPQGPSLRLTNQLYALHEAGREQEAINLVIERVDDWMLAGKPELLDHLLTWLEPQKMSPSLVLATLSAVHPMRKELHRREDFLSKARPYLLDKLGAERAQRLLRPWES
jgi:hypothetical protein